MQQDKGDLENKLRQWENQQLPDLSKMDEHWQQMQGRLIPSNNVAKKPINKNWLWAAAGILVIFSVILFSVFSGKNEHKSSVVETIIIKPEVPADTHRVVRVVASTMQILPRSSTSQNPRVISVKDSVGNFSMLRTSDTIIKTAGLMQNKVENKPQLSIEEKQIMLGELLGQIQKQAEVFTINNKRDTVIKGKEGTVIFIPANSLNTIEPVVFEVREFYKYSDMVANGLTTLSDERQLITGGMVYVSAKVRGKEVMVNPNKEIRIFIPNITASDSMQIFEGVKTSTMDKVQTNSVVTGKINWQLSKVRIDSPVSRMFIRAIDLRDDLLDYTVNFRGKTRAVFRMSQQSLYSKDELKAVLKKKHGDYYDKIIVRKPWKRNLLFKKTEDISEEEYGFVQNSWGVGDTAELLPGTVKVYKLTPIDTVYRIVKWVTAGYKDVQRPVFPAMALSNIGEKYSIGINKLGWINCDRFYKYEGRKSDFIIDLNDSAYNYITYLVFENFKSIMPGGGNGNYAVFANVPVGQPVKVISMGVKDGKTVATVKSTITSSTILKDLSFEPISYTTLKSSLKRLDN